MDWIISVTISLIGALIIFANYGILIENRKNQKLGIDGHCSMVPIVGPLLLFVGLANMPNGHGDVYWFVWALDPWNYLIVWWLLSLVFRSFKRI